MISKPTTGFTLVELILAVALMGILAALLGPPLTAAVRAYAVITTRSAALSDARTAMDRMEKEIRLISSSADILDVSSSTRFQFSYPSGTIITYDQSGTDLRRNGAAMVGNVTALSFKYYDATGGDALSAATLRRVQIELSLTLPGSAGTLLLRTNAFIRNVGNNYHGFIIQ